MAFKGWEGGEGQSLYPAPPQDWESMHRDWVLRKGIELVKIENGGSSLTFSLCRILRILPKSS